MITLLILLNAYFVTFIDKPEKTAPQLSERAWEQREKWGIKTDAMDYPVSPMYLNNLRNAGAKIYHWSRWFNGATVEMDAATASTVAKMSFVKSVEMTRDSSSPMSYYAPKHRSRRLEMQNERVEAAEEQLAAHTDEQLALYNLTPLHEAGFQGKGILMAICDGGFKNANTLSSFRQSQELGHFDLTDDPYDFYGYTGTHGVECLSAISGKGSNYMGAATEAQYYLMRSEENDTESPKEMDNLVVALEKADSLGVNVFSVSLGYAAFDNAEWSVPKSSFDGKSRRVSLAATIAARKGMLVCVAAGNEGKESGNPPHTLSCPADADSILTVGAVNTSKQLADFSSFGPTSDGRIKPEVCAVGWGATLINGDNDIVRSNGTSFATPLLAGMAASLWSALPKENAMQIRERIIRSADRYSDPQRKYGYGIPDAEKAWKMEQPQGLEDIPSSEVSHQKILRDGQLLILQGDCVYNAQGMLVQ